MRALTESEKAWFSDVLERIEKKAFEVTLRNRGIIPYTTVDGRFDDKSESDPFWWTNGFWGGEMWQLHALTGNEVFREEAVLLEEKLDRNLMSAAGLDHDNGFKWLPTSVIRYKKEKCSASLNRGILAAGNLAGRFNIAGNFFRAWNAWDSTDRRGYAIIDCMMNLPLLYWASEQSSDPRFKMMAMAHADTAIKTFVREDGSVNHIVVFDPFTGEVRETLGGQGFGKGSSWARGQGWGLYGFALSAYYTGEKRYLETSRRIADYVLSAMPESCLVPIDYRQPADADLEDSTAAAITASGLIELAEQLGDDGDDYLYAAIKLLRTLDSRRCSWGTDTDNILNNCAVDYHGSGHNMSIIYGDYFFIEAVMKLAGKALRIF